MTSKMVILKSSDGETFEVEAAVAGELLTIKPMVDDDCVGNGIPIPEVTSKILAKVLEYCKKHVDAAANPGENHSYVNNEDELKTWDTEFAKIEDQKTLFDLITAANYLHIKGLLDLLCKTVADMMRGKTTEEMRELFNIKNDYTPEEEADVRRENAWAFE